MNWEELLKEIRNPSPNSKHCKACNATFGNVPDKWNNKCPLCGDELQ